MDVSDYSTREKSDEIKYDSSISSKEIKEDKNSLNDDLNISSDRKISSKPSLKMIYL